MVKRIPSDSGSNKNNNNSNNGKGRSLNSKPFQTTPASVDEIEEKLAEIGYKVGIRATELIKFRMGDNSSVPVSRGNVFQNKRDRREIRLIQVLSYIHTYVWKYLFGHTASVLEKGVDNDDEYMITDNEPTIGNKISISREMGQLSIGAFIASIVESILDGYQFECKVSAHQTGDEKYPQRLTLLVKFSPDVIERELKLSEND